MSSPRLILVRGSRYEPLYRGLVEQYHYLGYRQIVGNHLKYIAYIGDRPVACLGWGSAAWSVKSRDTFIGWDKKPKIELFAFKPAFNDGELTQEQRNTAIVFNVFEELEKQQLRIKKKYAPM